jgi:alkaline phosphatase
MARLFCLLTLLVPAAVHAQGLTVRIMPPPRAQFLQFQKFDVRVEATSADATAAVTSIKVMLDGRDITSSGVTDSPSANIRNWTFRNMQLGLYGDRVLTAAATGASGANAISGSTESRITVRRWTGPALGAAAAGFDAGWPQPRRLASEAVGNRPRRPNDLIDQPVPRAKNVILFIGDGMGIASRTAGRILSKGYTGGKANGLMAMDTFPYNGMLMTSSLNSLVTDSAPGAHNYSTGNKTNNGMEGVFPDNTAADDDNPRIENLSEWLTRNLGKVTGIVSDAFITDATPAAFIAHTQSRGNGTLIASQYIDSAAQTNLKVLLGGGAYHFIPGSTAGSRRKDQRNVIDDFKAAGYSYVETATQLNAYSPGSNAKLLGLFNLDNMNVAFDKLGFGDPAVLGTFTDQPFLKDMTKRAIDVLKTYPNGFFLMVEGAHIDKQAHRMDAERSIYDVIQLDQAVQVALDFARQTNSDDDPNNDTLVIVSADHECAGVALPGVARPDKKGTRDYVKTYHYTAARNDSSVLNFTDYVDANGDGYPDNPDAPHKLIINFGANSDRYEDWQSNKMPKDPGVVQNGVVVANPNDPDKNAPGALMIAGVIENGSAGGDLETQAVHTMADIPISAYGPGASQFAKVSDNTEAFFYIVSSILGQYPAPPQY